MADEPPHFRTVDELRTLSKAELEALWATPLTRRELSGVYRGHVLGWIEHATARRPIYRWSQRLAFDVTPFGLDFDRRLWFFFTPRLATARFVAREHTSRWRDTDAFGLHYQDSRLPHGVRRQLYDEVKPLSERWVLGLGGINEGRGVGDHFYFVLERLDRGGV